MRAVIPYGMPRTHVESDRESLLSQQVRVEPKLNLAIEATAAFASWLTPPEIMDSSEIRANYVAKQRSCKGSTTAFLMTTIPQLMLMAPLALIHRFGEPRR